MSTFSIIMFVLSAFFAYQIYKHVQTLEDIPLSNVPDSAPADSSDAVLIDQADQAYEAGEIRQAYELLARANTQTPNTPEILNKFAFVSAALGNTDEAITLYLRSLVLDPKDDLAHNAVASVYRKKGDFQSAKEHYQDALDIDDEYVVTYFNYGNLLSEVGDRTGAEMMYKKALELDPELTLARNALKEVQG